MAQPIQPFPGQGTLWAEMMRLTNDETAAREFLLFNNVLPNAVTCPDCRDPLELQLCADSVSRDGAIWRCRPCSVRRTLRKNSILADAKFPNPCSTLIKYMWCFSNKENSSLYAATMLDLSEKTGKTERKLHL